MSSRSGAGPMPDPGATQGERALAKPGCRNRPQSSVGRQIMSQEPNETPPTLLSPDGKHAWSGAAWIALRPQDVSPDGQWVMLAGQWCRTSHMPPSTVPASASSHTATDAPASEPPAPRWRVAQPTKGERALRWWRDLDLAMKSLACIVVAAIVLGSAGVALALASKTSHAVPNSASSHVIAHSSTMTPTATETPSPAPVAVATVQPTVSPVAVSTPAPEATMHGAVLELEPNSDHYGSGKLVGAASGDCVSEGEATADLAAGSQVTIKDADGQVVGTGPIAQGRLVNSVPGHSDAVAGYYPAYDYLSGSCRFPFTTGPLPASNFYTVTLGARNPVTVTSQQVTTDSVPDIDVP